MRIIGFNFTKLFIERKEKYKENLEITNDLSFDDIIKENLPDSKEEILKFYFTFKTTYKPEVAQIELKGHLITHPTGEEMKNITKQWKNKEISNELRIPLLNYLLEKCSFRALELEEKLALPPHIPFPKVKLLR